MSLPSDENQTLEQEKILFQHFWQIKKPPYRIENKANSWWYTGLLVAAVGVLSLFGFYTKKMKPIHSKPKVHLEPVNKPVSALGKINLQTKKVVASDSGLTVRDFQLGRLAWLILIGSFLLSTSFSIYWLIRQGR